MDPIFIFALFGLLIGSFLNVAIWRVPLKLSVLSPSRSFCPKCENQLTWWENIPVVSWILLKARCSNCKEKISGRYPFVELLSALFAAFTAIKFGATPTAILIYLFCATMIVISFIDYDHKIIPNIISFPGMAFGLFLGCFTEYTEIFNWPITDGAMDSLLGFLAGGGFFWLIAEAYYLIKGVVGLGGGDIKLTAMIGAILGINSIVPTIFAASIVGAVFGIISMVISGRGRKTEIPFGPFLAAGALLFIFYDFEIFRIFPR